MSHIQKTPQGTYKVRWTDPATGVERSRNFSRLRDATAFRIDLDSKIQNATYVDPRGGRIRLGEYAAAWLESRKSSEARRRIADNAIRLHIAPHLGAFRLNAIETEHIQRWVDQLALTLSPGSVRNVYEVLAQILASAVNKRLIVRSPIVRRGEGDPVKLPTVEVEERWLIPEEVEKLIVCSPEDIRVLTQFLASTGLRIGEALGLQVGSVDLQLRQVQVTRQRMQDGSFGPTKTRKSRSVPVPVPTFEAIRPLLVGRDREADLWMSDLEEPLMYRAFRYRWKKTIKAAGLGWEPTAHDLRHYYASRLIKQGVDVVRVSGYLGHATVTKTLNVYGHLIGHDHSDVDAAFGDLPGRDGL
jgi:integrase